MEQERVQVLEQWTVEIGEDKEWGEVSLAIGEDTVGWEGRQFECGTRSNR